MSRFGNALAITFVTLVGIAVTSAILTYVFFVSLYWTKSGSMLPTLSDREPFLAFRRYADPVQGDIVVFTYPGDPNTRYVHRLIGMPGDRIQMVNGHLRINDQPVKRAQIKDFIDRDIKKPIKQWSETLPNGVIHRTIDLIEPGFYDNTQVYTVPDGHYFMMGDNRDNATDSRVKSRTVPRENIIGRVFFCLRSACR